MDWVDYTPLLFCCFSGFVSIGMLALAIWSLSWPRVKGKVEVSVLDNETDGRKETEEFYVAYSYEVDSVKYLGGMIKPWGKSNWALRGGGLDGFESGKVLWSGARDAAKWYRPGGSVDVYYCPWRPQWACLEPGGFLAPLVIGGVALGLYLGCVR